MVKVRLYLYHIWKWKQRRIRKEHEWFRVFGDTYEKSLSHTTAASSPTPRFPGFLNPVLNTTPHNSLSQQLAAFQHRLLVDDEWRLSHWLFSNVGKNVGRAGFRTSWIDSLCRYRLNYRDVWSASPLSNCTCWADWLFSLQMARVTLSHIYTISDFWKHCC